MIIHDKPQPLAPWLVGKPAALQRTLGSFTTFCHLMSDLPGEAGHQELLEFASRIGLRHTWIQHAHTGNEHFDIFDGAIGKAARAGARQVERDGFVAVMQARREVMNRQGEAAAPAANPDKPPLVAVTLWAPWAFAVAWLGKDVENRLWQHARLPRWLIGRQLAIHAGSETRWTKPGWDAVIEVMQEIYPNDWRERLAAGFLRFLPDDTQPITLQMILSPAFRHRCCSRIVAVTKVADILPINLECRPHMNGWHATDHEGIKLEGTVALPVGVPCGGTVTPVFWTVPDDVVKATRIEYKAALEGAVPQKIALPQGEVKRRSSTSPEADQLTLNLR